MSGTDHPLIEAPSSAQARPLRRVLLPLLTLALVAVMGLAATPAAQAAPRPNPVTPGNLTGYGFDQCLAPTQGAMDRWLDSSPFLAVGIYVSGKSRACRSQPNLNRTWVRKQLRQGWRLLPITLGPQASCQPRFPRYRDDVTINPSPGSRYAAARRMGRAEARTSVRDALALGLTKGSTLWYDLEGYDSRNTSCRESALAFLSGWSYQLHRLGWVSGVYSSAGSGIADLDSARVNRPKAFVLPDAIWVARWDGVANTSTSYIREDGWRPGGRVKQYQGGHVETWGGVSINIDRNYLQVGRGSVAAPESHCGRTRLGFRSYHVLRPGAGSTNGYARRVRAAQCLLTERGLYAGTITGSYDRATVAAVRAWRSSRGMPAGNSVRRTQWMSLLAAGPRPVVKVGSAGPQVRRVQRSLNATSRSTRLRATGVMDASTQSALRGWQRRAGLSATGILTRSGWFALARGRR